MSNKHQVIILCGNDVYGVWTLNNTPTHQEMTQIRKAVYEESKKSEDTFRVQFMAEIYNEL
jgi:hypothetical protein